MKGEKVGIYKDKSIPSNVDNKSKFDGKSDMGKPRVAKTMKAFPLALIAISELSDFGSEKYPDTHWHDVPDGFNRYSDAMMRHFLSEGGDCLDKDIESGLLHITATAWNAMGRLEILLRTNKLNNRK
jgi:hypothetical protein